MRTEEVSDTLDLVSLFLQIKSRYLHLFLEDWFSLLAEYSVLASVQRAIA